MNNDIDLHDRVAEAYYGKLGKKLMKETQHRIHWICKNITGNRILDVGCSQGILPLLLGREGKSVLGLDISQKAIDEANKSLTQEEEDVRENIIFERSNFMLHDFKDEKFDSIIIAEVLEHLVNPEEFIIKTKSLLQDNGTLIITVPFGINDFIDHKKTYYYLDMHQMLSPYFHIEEVLILGKWIGFIVKNQKSTNKDSKLLDENLLEKIEKSFYSIESHLLDSNQERYKHIEENSIEITNLKRRLDDANKKYKESHILIGELREEITTHKEEVNGVKSRLDDANKKYKESYIVINELRDNLDIERKERKEEVNSVKRKLGIANKRYKESTSTIDLQKQEITALKQEITALKQELTQLKDTHTTQGEKLILTQSYLDECQNSASFKLGHLLIHETKSLSQVLSLPKNIKKIKNSTKNKKKITIKKKAEREEDLSTLGWIEEIDENKSTIMAIFDEFTHTCYTNQYNLIEPRPDNFKALLQEYKPQFLFVESTWKGNFGSWQYRVAKYANPPGNELQELVLECNKRGIPTIFWNKEDPVHFDNFKHIAPWFDYVFTSADEAIKDYKKISDATINVLQFAAQEQLHNPINSLSRKDAVCFAGSYYANRFIERQEDQLMLLRSAKEFNLEIYDRNFSSDTTIKSDFAFPTEFDEYVIGSLPYVELLQQYKKYKVFLNVNSIIDSKTMFSRRIFELLACGTPVISTQAIGIEETFGKDIVWIVKNKEEADTALNTLFNNPKEWRRRSLKGIRSVLSKHTYKDRALQIEQTIFNTSSHTKANYMVFALVNEEEEFNHIKTMFQNQELLNINATLHIITRNQDIQIDKTISNVAIIQQDKDSSLLETLNSILIKESYAYISFFSDNAIYGKYFLNDSYLALNYSNAMFHAKPKTMQDIYDFHSDIFNHSIVCDYRQFQKNNYSLSTLLSLIVNDNNSFYKNEIFVSDAANFYHVEKTLSLSNSTNILEEIQL